MISRLTLLPLIAVLLAGYPLRSAEDAPKSRMKEVLKARIAEDAKRVKAKQGPATASPNAAASKRPDAPDAEKTKAGEATAKSPEVTEPEQTASKPAPTILPKVEVKKSRITELDQKLAKQEQDIARERKNLKASEVDTALNDAKIATPLSIFGGESAQFRQRVASERVELMEAEKDLIEAIAHAKTKPEKQKLQKQLDELKSVRRELEKSLR
jgi:hypothetical protein